MYPTQSRAELCACVIWSELLVTRWLVVGIVWDDEAIASAIVPLAVAAATPVQIPSNYYYGIPVRPIYKSYPAIY